MGYDWRNKDELISDLLQWTPAHGRAKVGRPARNYIQQLCVDIGCNQENLPGVIDDIDGWRERVREIRAGSATWWWWWPWVIFVLCVFTNPFTAKKNLTQGQFLAEYVFKKPSATNNMWHKTKFWHQLIGLVGRVFDNGPGDVGSIPGHVIPKILKKVLDASLLKTQQYKVHVKGKVEVSRERSSTLS